MSTQTMKTHPFAGRAALRHCAAVAAAAALACILLLAGCTPQATDTSNGNTADGAASSAEVSQEIAEQADALRIGSLKGPTSIGLASMMEAEEGVFTIAATADEIAPLLLRDELDIALIPANLAATLYQRSEGQIRVIDVNTLGVLYAVTAADIDSVDGLRGRTIYMTGKGSVPEYTLRALLAANGIQDSDIDLQFRSEPSEVAALISQDPDAVGILPQPYAVSATMKDGSLREAIDLTQAWDEATDGASGTFITGVTVARASLIDEHPEVIAEFLRRHALSAEAAEADPASIVSEVVSMGIIDNAEIAEAAIPRCNVIFMAGEEMESALSGFLKVLFEQDPSSIGGAMPESSFYFMQ